jgi:hypothetical protein
MAGRRSSHPFPAFSPHSRLIDLFQSFQSTNAGVCDPEIINKHQITGLTEASYSQELSMAKPGRKVKKANHGRRPACSRPRKNRRHQVKT